MATALVQAKASAFPTSPFTTAGITTTAGNALAISVTIYDGGAANVITSFSDNKGNTFSLSPASPSSIGGGASSEKMYVYTCPNILGGAGHTFTVAETIVGDGGTIIVTESSGCTTGTLLRADAAYIQTGGHQTHAGATVTAYAGDIVLAFSSDDNRASDAFTAGLGLTIPANGSLLSGGVPGFVQYVANAAAGNVTGAYTTTQFAAATQIIVALAAAGGATVTNQQQMMMGMG